MRDGPLPDAQAIVVLASDAESPTPPQPAAVLDSAGANRLLYAAQLYRQRKAPTVILSGGRLPWLRKLPPMSQTMADIIELMGVPKSAVIQESHSANTYENAVGVKALLAQRHINRVLLVTSAMHMPRALALFKHQGIDAIPAPCDFVSLTKGDNDPDGWQATVIKLIPDSNTMVTTGRVLKESLGIAVYRAAGLL